MIRTLASLFHAAGRVGATSALGLSLVAVPATAQVPANSQPKTGGTLRMATSAAPATLNPYFDNSAPTRLLANLDLQGLARVAPDGSYLPVLAAEIPTQANGDVSPDGTVVTWKLKPGVTWADGQPFSSQDVVLTYQMIMDPTNPVRARSDYVVMDSVAASGDNTVVVTYKQLYAPYRLAFPPVFLPQISTVRPTISMNPSK